VEGSARRIRWWTSGWGWRWVVEVEVVDWWWWWRVRDQRMQETRDAKSGGRVMVRCRARRLVR
jgi:hypothetical protein